MLSGEREKLLKFVIPASYKRGSKEGNSSSERLL